MILYILQLRKNNTINIYLISKQTKLIMCYLYYYYFYLINFINDIKYQKVC